MGKMKYTLNQYMYLQFLTVILVVFNNAKEDKDAEHFITLHNLLLNDTVDTN
jgi:hypothetical protein